MNSKRKKLPRNCLTVVEVTMTTYGPESLYRNGSNFSPNSSHKVIFDFAELYREKDETKFN